MKRRGLCVLMLAWAAGAACAPVWSHAEAPLPAADVMQSEVPGVREASPHAATRDEPGTDAAGVAAVIAEFDRALAQGDGQRVLELMDEDAMVFESGHVEQRRDDYAQTHLPADLRFAAGVRRTVLRRDAQLMPALAVVLTQARIDGSFENRAVSLDSTETMVLRQDAEGWKIVHIHWSSHDRR